MSRTSTRGRRAGGADTRGEILAAARVSFAERGYAGTSVRAVASAAGVDSALVHHYFGSKDDLFLAALEFPVDPRAVMAEVAAGPREELGVRLLRGFLSVWDRPEARQPLVAVVRSGIAGEPARSMVETALQRLVFGTLASVLELDDADRRVALVASQMVGLVVARYVLSLEPLASMPAEEVVAWLGPTVQRYLTAPEP
jgi:AcrR family transcriptional regulator